MRINKAAVTTSDTAMPVASDADDYMNRLVKLVPAESIAAYPVLMNAANSQPWAMAIVAWSLLLVTCLIRWHKSKHPVHAKPQWTMILISAGSFVIWVEAFGGSFGVLDVLQTFAPAMASVIEQGSNFIATLTLVLWTIIVPMFYTGD